MKENQVKKLVMAAMCVALGIVLPMAFHTIQNAGSIFLPMHIPVLICGLLCGWQYGLICGILAPVLSSLFTGMPPAAILPAMLCELAVYGLITGICVYGIHTEKQIVKNIWFADHSDAGRENCQRYFKSTYFQCGRI